MAQRCLIPFYNICSPGGVPLTGYTDADTGEQVFYTPNAVVYNGVVESCTGGDTGGTVDGCCNTTLTMGVTDSDLTVTVTQSGGATVTDTVDLSALETTALVRDNACNAIFQSSLDGAVLGADTEQARWTYIADSEVCPRLSTDICGVDRFTTDNTICLTDFCISVPIENIPNPTPTQPSHGGATWTLYDETGRNYGSFTLPANVDKICFNLEEVIAGPVCLYPILNSVGSPAPIAPILSLEFHRGFDGDF